MSTPYSPSLALKRRVFLSWVATALIIALTLIPVTGLVQVLVWPDQSSSPWQLALLNNLPVVALISMVLCWLVQRPLVLHALREEARADRERQSDRQLRDALDAHALVSFIDRQGGIRDTNDKFCEISGYSREELVAQNPFTANAGQRDRSGLRTLWRTLERGHIWQGELLNHRKDGTPYWVDSTIVPLRDANGKPHQFLAICRDISVLKEHEARLIRLKQAMDASGEMIFITDAHGLIQYANPALLAATGLAAEALIGRTPAPLDVSDNDPGDWAEMRTRLNRQLPWSGRLRCRRHGVPPRSAEPDSRISVGHQSFWVQANITPIVAPDKTLLGYVRIQRDIDADIARQNILALEREDAKARLTISQMLEANRPLDERYAAVLDVLFSLPSFDLQRKGGVFLCDDAGGPLRLFVLRGEFTDEFRQRELCVPLGACLCGRAAFSGELLVSDDCFCDPRHEHRFEGMQPHGHYVVPLVHEGKTLGVLFLYTDPNPPCSEMRLGFLRAVGEMMALALLKERAQAELSAARDAALQAASAKAAFLANISHEIRTPMSGVLGMLDLLKDTELSQEQSQLVETAASSALSLLDVMNDVLDYSKLEADKFELEELVFDLPALAGEVCALVAGQTHNKGLELLCFVPADLPDHWHGDPTRIRQILANLLGNAVKFTERGEVALHVQAIAPADLGRGLRFEVRDTGIGISALEQARLFQPFIQADNSTARRFGGTGLGLSICKQLIELMGGVVGVESQVGQGARFWFELPLRPEDTDIPTADRRWSGARVLVVDDNTTNRVILRHYLEHWGLLVDEAEHGSAALEMLRARSYQAVLLDRHMPQMDGIAFARIMQADPALSTIPRLLLTSSGMVGTRESAHLGIRRCLLKPIRPAHLFEALNDVLSVRSTASGGAERRSSKSHPGRLVLIAEDDRVNQKVIQSMLTRYGITPEFADTGEDAFGKWAEGHFDLIFMDCRSPVMDGYTVTRLIREQECATQRTPTPVVALTAYAGEQARDKCVAAGMDDYLSKPIDSAQLERVLNRWLGAAVPINPKARAMPTASSPLASAPLPEPIQPGQDTGGSPTIPMGRRWDPIRTLDRLQGDKKLLEQMQSLFIDEIQHRITELRGALTAGDRNSLGDAAHAIKGMASQFCADSLYSLALTLEGNARSGLDVDYTEAVEGLAEAALALAHDLKLHPVS